MLISALAALVMFAAPEATQAGETAAQTEAAQSQAAQSQAAKPEKSAKSEAKGPSRTCYNATPSGSRLPRKVCVTKAAESAKDDVEAGKPN
ncbi:MULTISPECIES: hypothetical protein [unclassified Phenylobacterium]|jgi:hypothetical protein|uniref:hypothetical protein n=1 Tax=unclassified Phenylobacterium TaxID=2640670 RepID=UPI000839F74E|nr:MULTISPECIES: hypothetical protein [unclassified Phenylobacterium]